MNIDEIKAELQQLKDEKYHLLKLINHDIRSPFNRLFALLQLFELESDEQTVQQTQYLDSMYLSILSGLEMIQNLRDMRELDAGYVEITPSEIKIEKIVDDSIKTFSKQLELKKIEVKKTSSESECVMLADEYYLQRIIENVLSNAIKFSKEGKEVEVGVICENSSLKITIRDFGEGIKHDEDEMLFQKFRKLSSFATGGEGSLGLGLYNAMSFVKMMNGNISLNRDVEPGTSFTITVPFGGN